MSRPPRVSNRAETARRVSPRMAGCHTLAPGTPVPMLLSPYVGVGPPISWGGGLKRTKADGRRHAWVGALLLGLVGLVGVGCASTGAPHREPASLASQPVAPTEVAAALPAAPASGALEDARAAVPAPEAPAAAAAATDASADFDYQPEVSEPDPFEPMNRGIFHFNRGLDHVLIGPLARGYAWTVPAPGRRAVRRVFENLDTPVVVTNSLLQLEVRHAAVATLRFALNSTVGVLGLFDPAQAVGLTPVVADFGQTLGRLGVGTGPYIVIPVLGPTNARDGIGTFVDSLLRPQTWLLTPAEGLVLASSDGITMRDEEGPALQALEDSSVDFYAALRAAYFMHRQALVDGEADSPAVAETPPPASAPEALPPALPEVAPAAPVAEPAAATQLGAAVPLAPAAAAARSLSVVPAAPAP